MISDTLRPLADLSARIGRNPLLAQASTGNTSIKQDGQLWIKASAKWLADAHQDDIFVSIELQRVRSAIEAGEDYCAEHSTQSGTKLTPSIETAMHAVLPQAVVIHVHSVNTIAWAVRQDARELLDSLLSGLAWQWIPYVPSGLPLAREIQRVLFTRPDVLVLGNHGLVVAGDTCAAAERTLQEVESRVAIAPRPAPKNRCNELEQLSQGSGWRLPDCAALHALGTDPASREIIRGGTLYPCHGIFLGPGAAVVSGAVPVSKAADCYQSSHGMRPPALIVDGKGVLLAENMTPAEREMLIGLLNVVQRIEAGASIRYLTKAELDDLMRADVYGYRRRVENGCRKIRPCDS